MCCDPRPQPLGDGPDPGDGRKTCLDHAALPPAESRPGHPEGETPAPRVPALFSALCSALLSGLLSGLLSSLVFSPLSSPLLSALLSPPCSPLSSPLSSLVSSSFSSPIFTSSTHDSSVVHLEGPYLVFLYSHTHTIRLGRYDGITVYQGI